MAPFDSGRLRGAKFMNELLRDGVAQCVLDEAFRLLKVARTKASSLPQIALGEGGLVGLTWQNQRHHVNVEVFADGHVEVFSEDLVAHSFTEEEMLFGESLSERALRSIFEADSSRLPDGSRVF